MMTLTDMPKGFKKKKETNVKNSSASPQLFADVKKVEQFAVNNDIQIFKDIWKYSFHPEIRHERFLQHSLLALCNVKSLCLNGEPQTFLYFRSLAPLVQVFQKYSFC